jgi:hypothetical protein
MAERKTFLLRIDGGVLDALRKWADDDLRSLNGQIEFLLRRSLRERGRLREDGPGLSAEGPGEAAGNEESSS